MTIEKLKGIQGGTPFGTELLQKLNEIIDHLNTLGVEKPTPTVKEDWIDEILEDMDDMKFHINSKYADWGKLREEVRESIENHMPKGETPVKKYTEDAIYNKYRNGDTFDEFNGGQCEGIIKFIKDEGLLAD